MRIESFNNELDILMQSKDREESLRLINQINDISEELSKVGA